VRVAVNAMSRGCYHALLPLVKQRPEEHGRPALSVQIDIANYVYVYTPRARRQRRRSAYENNVFRQRSFAGGWGLRREQTLLANPPNRHLFLAMVSDRQKRDFPGTAGPVSADRSPDVNARAKHALMK